jgi:hypothetical protein
MTRLRSVLISAVLVGFALAGVWVSVARAQSLTVSRGPQTQTITTAQFAAMPRASAHVVQHDQSHDFEGVSLAAILARVGVDASKPMSGRDLAAAVRVTAADGYQVVIALPDIDPATRKAPVILADREAGQPLKPDQGPWRLVVGDDIRPARSARQVTKIEVVDLATSTKAAAH